jgi:hypothetical protein
VRPAVGAGGARSIGRVGACAWLFLGVLAACEADVATVGADAGSMDAAEVTDDPCGPAPVTTWDNFGQGFLRTNCQGCHAAAAPDRHGAPPGAVFDTLEDVRFFRDRIVATAAVEAPTMPPAGGVRELDRLRLALWLRCSPEFASRP